MYRILIVRNDRLGDAVLTLPAFATARATWPRAHISVLVDSSLVSLWEMVSGVDRILATNENDSIRGLACRLRKERFDAALLINTNRRNLVATWRAGIPVRVAWAGKAISWILANRLVHLRRSHPPVHESEFALAFVRRLANEPHLDRKAPPVLQIPPSVRDRVDRRLARRLGGTVWKRPLFAVHPGNRGSAFNWPATQYARLAAQLANHGNVIVTGSAAERKLVEQVAGSAGRQVACFCDLSLIELAALLQRVDVLTVSSTGPMHLAGVLGTSTVALFSNQLAHSPEKWSPLGSGHHILQPATGEPDGPANGGGRQDAKMPALDIPLERVVRANLELVTSQGKRSRPLQAG